MDAMDPQPGGFDILPEMRRVESKNDLWTCTVCRRSFANRNQSHSCGRYSVEDFLKGKSQKALGLYKTFVQAVREQGPVSMAPAKTRVGFQVRMIFAAVNRLSERGLAGHVVLSRRIENPRFTRIDSISPGNHVHHFHIREVAEIDNEVRRWLKEAYDVGKQEHLARRIKKR
jgi:hypothetical protein